MVVSEASLKGGAIGVLLLVTIICSMLPGQLMCRNKPMVLEVLSFIAGGIFLGAGVIHMLPDAAKQWEDAQLDLHYPVPFLLSCIGFCVVYTIDALKPHAEHGNHIKREQLVAISSQAASEGQSASLCYVQIEPVVIYAGSGIGGAPNASNEFVRLKSGAIVSRQGYQAIESNLVVPRAAELEPAHEGLGRPVVTASVGRHRRSVSSKCAHESPAYKHSSLNSVLHRPLIQSHATKGHEHGISQSHAAHRDPAAGGPARDKHALDHSHGHGHFDAHNESKGSHGHSHGEDHGHNHGDDQGHSHGHGHSHGSEHSGMDVDHDHSHDDVHHHHIAISGNSMMPILLAIVFSVHSFIAGLALGIQSGVDSAAVSILVAILAHKVVEALSVGASFQKEGVVARVAFPVLFIYSLMTPAGIAAGWILDRTIEGRNSLIVQSSLQAVASGSFVFLAVHEAGIGNPSCCQHVSNQQQVLLLLTGLFLMAILAIWV